MSNEKKAAATAARIVSVACVFCGLAGVGWGLWQIYEPAAPLVVGCALVWIGLPRA